MWNEQIIMMLLEGIKDTLYMTDRADSVYEISDRKKLWTDGDDRSACHSSSTIYCTNG